MGCNTSKDSVPQAEAENKENQEGTGETTEGVNNEKTNEENEQNDTKSISAKTITLRSNGTAKSIEDTEAIENKPKTPQGKGPEALSQAKEESKVNEEASQGEEEQAATKIQAAFRGHKTRQSMKQPAATASAAGTQPEPEPTREQLEQEFRLDDAELCQAATKIQASFRGHMTRKHETEAKMKESSSCQEEKNQGKEKEEEELDIDLSDPDLNKAAVKIQASFRGHMVRKEHEGEDAAK